MADPIARWDYRHPSSVARNPAAEPGSARVYHGNVGSHVFHAPNHILPRRWRRISAAPVSRKCWLDNLRQSESLPQLGSLHR